MIQTPYPFSLTSAEGFIEEAQWHTSGELPLRVNGWIYFGPDRPWRRIVARVAEMDEYGVEYRERLDVGDALKGAVGAQRTGFEIQIPVLPVDAVLHLEAEFPDNSRVRLIDLPVALIPGRSALLGDYHHRPTPPVPVLHPLDPSPRLPEFTVVIPVFRPRISELRECLDSLCHQTYGDWRAVLVDDGSEDPELSKTLETYAAREDRFSLIRQSNQGIARASNAAINSSTGPWVCFLDQDDRLYPEALATIAQEIEENPEANVVYTDEEKITQSGKLHNPLFKPGWSPHFLRGTMYCGHLLCVRREVLKQSGPPDPTFDGVQDFELALRISETNPTVHHIPAVLYQWRMGEHSSAREGNIKGDMDSLQKRAVEEHLARVGHPGTVTPQGRHRLLVDPPEDYSIPSFVEIDVDSPRNVSVEPISEQFVVVRDRSQPECVIDSNSLRRLLFHADCSPREVFVPLFISQDGVVAESGCTISENGDLVRIMRGFDPQSDGFNGSLICHREVAATSGTLMVMSTAMWNQIRESLHPDSTGVLADHIWNSDLGIVVIANARARLQRNFQEISASAGRLRSESREDRFFNPHFDARRADYALTQSYRSHQGFRFSLPAPPASTDPRIRIIGWCLDKSNHPPTSARIGGVDWEVEASVDIDRPDVALQIPAARDQNPGFEFRFELPPGDYPFRFEVKTACAGSWVLLHEGVLQIESGQRCAPQSDPGKLIAFQLGLHPQFPLREPHFDRFVISSASAPQPRLSLTTPSYEQGRFLPRTVTSVADNDLEGIDYVIQDAGSKDETTGYLRTLDQPHLRWFQEPDNGQADAIARGFEKSRFREPDDLMAWINADDFYVPGALDFVRSFFAQHPEIDVLYGNRIVVNEQGLELNRWHLPGHDSDVLPWNDYVPQETLFWRRRIWDQVGGIDTKFQFALDWDLLLRFQQASAKIVHVPEFLACFRVHSAQKTSSQMQTVGSAEMNRLRKRSFGREIATNELNHAPAVQDFLIRSYELSSQVDP